MSGGPKNASINGDGFRFYRWTDAATQVETDVLSVTSIRKLCGEPFTLVNWQIANLVDAALGTMKRTTIGPRGGVKEKRQVWEFPSEFARKYDATKGAQGGIDEVRRWLRESAEEPRNIAAMRGTMTHEAIEKNVTADRIEMPWVEAAFERLSPSDRKRNKRGIIEDDVSFVHNSVRQYWDMREHVPFIIVAREVQVFNLTAGYAGSFDALVWMLGHFDSRGNFIDDNLDVTKLPKGKDITLEAVKKHGGTLVLLDWKTSKGVYTDQVVQAHAYMTAEFVGSDGIKDHRLTELLTASMVGGLVHIRPNGWAIHVFKYTEEVVRAFLGSCAFARFLAKYTEPFPLFTYTVKGNAAPEEDIADADTD